LTRFEATPQAQVDEIETMLAGKIPIWFSIQTVKVVW